jgi:two-component system cell cycle response regulator
MIANPNTCTKTDESVGADSTFTESANLTFKTPAQISVRSANQQACLVYIYPTGPLMGNRYPLGEESVVIGRSEDCAIRNVDESVSRNHVRIFRDDDGGYSVFDLGSTNGTFVNNTSCRGCPLRDGDTLRVGNCIYRFLAGGNIEADYHEEIYKLTIQDGLTQVHNRRYLIEYLERELIRSVRHKRPLTLILLDIDHFKAVNDKLGHLAGDMALRELCARVRSVIRQDELLARYGGEEFAIVLPEVDAAAARATAERIRLLVEHQPFVFNNRSYKLTVSAGVAHISEGESPTIEGILSHADSNLYRAKQSGRNRVVLS